MRVTLLHNPTAGDEDVAGEALRSLIAGFGHEVRYRSVKEKGWKAALGDPGDLVAVAGGDGAVGKVFKKASTRSVLLTLLPTGSANNIARTLGVADTPIEDLVGGWGAGERRPFDLGQASAPWGTTLFAESIGGGLFRQVLDRGEQIEADDAEGREKVQLGLVLMREAVLGAPTLTWGIEIDGVDASGEFVAVEAMNIAELGPNFPLAPRADAGDGLLDIALVGPEHRESVAGYFEDRLAGTEPRPPQLPVLRGARVVLRPPDDCLLHVDDESWPEEAEADSRAQGAASITVGPSLTLLLPRAAGEPATEPIEPAARPRL